MLVVNEDASITSPYSLDFNREAFVSKSDIYGTKGIAVGSGAADTSGHVIAKRLFVGEQPGDNPQGANYIDGVRITQKWIGVNPNDRAKWMGLYIFNSIQQMTADTATTQDLYGANIQTGIYDPSAPIPRNFFQVFGSHNVAYHDSPGTVTNMLGVNARGLLQRGNAGAVYGANGNAVVQANGGTATVAYGVSGQVRVENAGGTMTQASAVRAIVGLNAGTMTNAHGVFVDNAAIGGSGTGKYGIYIQPQTVATPGNWTTVENFHSAGDVPNVFEGLIKSTRSSASGPPLQVASNVLVPNLNANMIEGQDLAALDARYARPSAIMPKARQISSNRFFPPFGRTPNLSSAALPANTLVAIPYDTSIEMNGIGIEVTAPAAGSSVRLGIYACGTNGKPGQLIADAGTVDSSTAGIKVAALAAARQLNQPFWLVALSSHAVNIRSSVATDTAWQFGTTSFTGGSGAVSTTAAQTFGALPASFPASSTESNTGFGIYARGS